jgi:hypothetical protein
MGLSSSGKDKLAKSLSDNPKPDAQVVEDFHANSDLDVRPEAQHHTIGPQPAQAASGAHTHNGSDSVQLLAGVTIVGARGGNTAVASIIAALVKLGATDSTTA